MQNTRWVRYAVPVRFLVACVCFLPTTLLAAEAKWISLVDRGKISDKWETKGNWRVRADGTIFLEPRPGEEGWRRFDAYLWSRSKFKDFEVQFEYKFQPEGNSGFFFRVGEKKSPVENGLEVQLMDNHGLPENAELNSHDSGGIIPGFPPSKRGSKPAREWNSMTVSVVGDKLTVVLNGQIVNQLDLSQKSISNRPRQGYIGFQDHGELFELRNVRYRNLARQSP